MKKFGIILLVIVVLLGSTSDLGFAENIKQDKLTEKYQLLKEENLRLRDEILKLRNLLSKNSAEKIPVLLYHHLLPKEDIVKYNWSNNSSVLSVETFEDHMDYLYQNGFYTATLDELQSFLDGEITLPEKTVVITFDDGYYSNALYAYPIMKKYNFRGTIFMLGYRVDDIQQPFDPSTTQSLSLNEAYKYEDVFDYESHTYELHDMNDKKVPLLLALDEEVIIEDLTKSKELLNAKYFAYPYGKYDEKTIEYLETTEYEIAFTINTGYVNKKLNKYELPRFSMTPNKMPFSRFMRIVNGLYE